MRCKPTNLATLFELHRGRLFRLHNPSLRRQYITTQRRFHRIVGITVATPRLDEIRFRNPQLFGGGGGHGIILFLELLDSSICRRHQSRWKSCRIR